MKKLIYRSGGILARASGGDPAVTTATIMLFYICFNFFEGMLEKLIFGERFEHFLDPIFCMAFIAYAAFSVYCCAIVNSSDGND